MWFEDNIKPLDYMVEIYRPNEEFNTKCYNTDFTEVIKTEDEEGCEIFSER